MKVKLFVNVAVQKASTTPLRSTPTTDRPRDGDVTRTRADLVKSRLRSSVMRSRSLNCHADSIVVSLSKHLIQVSTCIVLLTEFVI